MRVIFQASSQVTMTNSEPLRQNSLEYILGTYPILQSIMCSSHRSGIAALSRTSHTIRNTLTDIIDPIVKPFPMCMGDKRCMWCTTPTCAECEVEAVHIYSQFVLISHNGHLYTILGGDNRALTDAARTAIERTMQRGIKRPKITLMMCKNERYYFCESCFSDGGEVVSGTAPEWVG